MRRILIVAIAVLEAAVPIACQSAGVPTAELPDDPIALVYREPEMARRRAELLLDKEDPLEPREGVAKVGRITDYLSELTGARDSRTFAARFAGQLALLQPRTGNLTLVKATVRGAIPLAWSPDHSRLLFTQPVGGRLQIFEWDATRDQIRQITTGPAAHPRGCYGPDRRFVVMTVEGGRDGPRATIRLTAPGGGGGERLSIGAASHSPACAPDGSAVAWVAPGSRGERVVVRSPAATGPVRELAPGRDPTFTPDGHWLAYSGPVAGSWKLFRIRPNGTGRVRIGNGALEEQRPAISPDGRYVVYLSELGSRERLYLRRFDGTGDRLLFRDGDGAYPVW